MNREHDRSATRKGAKGKTDWTKLRTMPDSEVVFTEDAPSTSPEDWTNAIAHRGLPEVKLMRTVKFTSWQDGEFYIGFLNDYPDYLTQGVSKEELADNLKSLLTDLESGEIPYLRKVEELLVA